MISAYLLDIIILLIAAVIAVPLSQTVRLGAVPGFLIAGVVVGPYGLGLISNIKEITNLAEIGVVLLLFVIGIELKPSRLWSMKRLVFGLGTLQVLVTGVLLGAVAHLLFEVSLKAAFLIGPALALSSTAFVIQLLNERKMLLHSFGRASVAVLLLQDLAVVPLLLLVPLLAISDMAIGEDIGIAVIESLVVFGLVVVLGRYMLHPLLHRVALSRNTEVFTASAVLIVMGTAYLSEHVGLSMAMGAFLAGLLMSDSFYRHQVLAEIQPFRGLLLGLFFMSMGMSLDINLLVTNPLVSIGLVGLLIAIKSLTLFPMAYWFGLGINNSMGVATILSQSGEFALVLFSLAFQQGVIDESLFQQLMLLVLLSMLVTPFLANIAKCQVEGECSILGAPAEPPEEAPIVIAGFGRVGHRIGEILAIAGESFVALDVNPQVVERERARGHKVFFGDVRNPELLEAAGATNAKTIIVTLNDPEATEQLVTSLRRSHPGVEIYARGQTMEDCRNLKKLGATGVVSENIEASLELARMTLRNRGIDSDKGDMILSEFRRTYHAQIDE